MSDKPKGRARGRGRGQDLPPPPGGQQAMPPPRGPQPQGPRGAWGPQRGPSPGGVRQRGPSPGDARQRGPSPGGPGGVRQRGPSPSGVRQRGPSPMQQQPRGPVYPAQQFGAVPVMTQQTRPPQPTHVPQQPRPAWGNVAGQRSVPTASQTSSSESSQQQRGAESAQTRGYCRGADRMAAASSRPSQGPFVVESELAPQFSNLEVGGNGNGSNGNGNGNGNGEEASVGRGMTRGPARYLDGRLPVLRPHSRTKQGTAQRCPVRLMVNYFSLEKKENWQLYQYSVQYSPPQDDRRQMKEIMSHHLKHFGENFVFNYQEIFSTVRLHEKVTSFTSQTDVVYTVTVTLVKELDPLDFQFFSILNRILHHCQTAMNLKQIGKLPHFFNTSDCQTLDAKLNLKVYPGYHTSIRQHEDKILLNVDIVHKFQQTRSFLQVLEQCRSNAERQQYVGSIVMCIYDQNTYPVHDIVDDKSPRSTFNYRGNPITYIDYVQQKYNMKIRNPSQPMVFSRPSKRQQRRGMNEIYLVPELLTLTGIPENTRSNFQQMKLLADFTKMGDDRRVDALRRFNQKLQGNDTVRNDLLKWGLTLSKELVTVDSRVLPAENIALDGAMTDHDSNKADWSFQCRGKKMSSIVHLKNWVVFCHSADTSKVSGFLDNFKRAATSTGMQVAKPEIVTYSNFPELQNTMRNYAGCQIIMIFMTPPISNKYGQIKKLLACQLGVLSQCVLTKHFNKPQSQMSICTKIAIQMNAKLGGEPWRIAQPAKGLMVVGYDAYHDSEQKEISYGAVVSSLDDKCTRYLGQVSPNSKKEELTTKFEVFIRNAVEQFARCNENKMPSSVLVYRDGVGEGQEKYVKDSEIPAIQKQLQLLSPNRLIPLVFVVVTKRINTRLFAVQGRNLANPVPGTVLDHTVTLPERYDFFLVSQFVTQGTVSPTAYNVLEDESKFNVDQIQRLTYKFTHLYFNWQGTVRVPAPCLYAHKLAYITGTGTHELPKTKLQDKLWFI